MAEPVTIGGQTFIKTPEGWLDKKTKVRAPESLFTLLNSLTSESTTEYKKLRVRIDSSKPPVSLAGEEYVFDLNQGKWINKKTRDAVNDSLQKVINGVLEKLEAEKASALAVKKQIEAKYPNAKTTASGLMVANEVLGTGMDAIVGKTVSVHYTGRLMDGTVFDSSVERGEPIDFKLGAGMVIKGWDEGIALLQVGDKARFVIPSDLAYGTRGAGGVIPPNATLIFDVELMDVK